MDMSIYDRIKDKFIMKNAWEDWASYRSQLTELILEHDPESVIIIGAGRCNDIDLFTLLSGGKKVICVDVDVASMRTSMERLPDNLRSRIECKNISLTGISEKDMEVFCDRMLSSARDKGQDISMDYLRSEMLLNLEALQKKLIQSEEAILRYLPEKSADTVVCCGVHSQLFSTLSFFIKSMLGSLYDIIPEVTGLEAEADRIIRDMNNSIIPIINNALIRAAGRYIIFGNEYSSQSPVEGAEQCIRNVRENMNPFERHLRWDFNSWEGVIYDMLIQECILS